MRPGVRDLPTASLRRLRRLSPALCPAAALTMKPPSVQSPFARFWRYLHRGDVPRLLGRHYSSVLAHTDSCADPVWLSSTSVLASSFLRPMIHAIQQAMRSGQVLRHHDG